MTSPRDTYLAWQAEIGTEEVVMATPWVRRAPVSHTQNAAASGVQGSRPESLSSSKSPPGLPEVHFEPMKPFVVPGMPAAGAGPDFFGAIAEQLAKADTFTGLKASQRKKAAAANGAQSTASQSASPLSPLLTSLAGLKDLDAYWAFLEAEYPVWFSGSSAPLKRSSGHAAPRLAVVELLPGADGIFGGDSGTLLDRMMNAIGVTRDQLYLTSLMKSSPATSKSWARKDTARMVPVLVRELQLAQCGLVLVMGEACAQAVLKTGRSVPDLLKSPVDAEGLSLSATWHPAEIRAGDAAQTAGSGDPGNQKAARPRATQAWEHLQWLRGLLPAR